MKSLLCIFITLISYQALAYRPDSSDTSIYNECLWNKDALSIKVDCNDVYNHYKPQKRRYRPSQSLRVGSYNIFRSSQERNKKNIPLTAALIDSQWDVVALSELQPGSTVDIKNFKETGDYTLPAYIKILNELQTLDPSWGLITSAYSQGADSEIFGFLYRANQIKPVESEYCKANYLDKLPFTDNFIYREITQEGFNYSTANQVVNDRKFIKPSEAIACPLSLTGLYKKRFPKVPLTARFISGDFEFSYISLHLSFRSYGESESQCRGTCNLNILQLISTLSGTDDNPIISTIDSFNQKKENQNVIEALDMILPTSCDGFKSKAPEQKKYETCRNKITHFFNHLKEKKFPIPAACKKLVKDPKSLQHHESCDDELEDVKDKELELLMSKLHPQLKKHEKNTIFSQNTIDILNELNKDGTISKGEGRALNRFFQAYVATREAATISNSENNNDIILGGDFNLEIEHKAAHWRAKAWQQVLSNLPGSQVLIEEKTSLNSSLKLGKNYDHFILVNEPGATDECNTKSAQVINFTDPSLVLSNGLKIGEEVLKEDYHYAMSDHLPIEITCSTK